MGRRFRVTIGTMLAIILAAPALLPAAASAFSAYGAGTSANPYRIATCAQLSEIDNNLAAYYVLVSNIDCSGSTFIHLAGSSAFSGTLDGQNHTISNLNVDDLGLFSQTNGAIIKNITIASGSVSGGYVASFVQDATDTTFTNIHSAMSITNTSGYTGGLVGELHGTASISQSSFTGSMSTTGYVGGVVGAMWDAGTSVTDSFASGTLSSHSAYEGGIVGGFFNGTINRVYSSMTITLNGNPYDGGIVGDDQGAVSNSFSAATLSGSISNDGALVGLDVSGTYTNDYFDETTNNTTSCFGLNGSGSCTGVNASNATPNYFKNNSTNAPLNAWDFSTIWQTTSSYPTLRNIASFTDASAPNNGDANGDGVVDSYQANVASVQGSDGAWMTITVPASSGCTIVSPRAIASSSFGLDPTYKAQVNFAAFNLYCPTAGASTTVTIIYDKQYDTSKAVLRYYNQNTQTYSTISDATFGTKTIGGVVKTIATYPITDGGVWDGDGTANGIIVDPVAFSSTSVVLAAEAAAAAPNTGAGTYSSTSPLLSALAIAGGASIVGGVALLQRRRL